MRTIEGLRFVETCGACPEQYDVFRGDEQVGYVRLRHGQFRVEVPACGGNTVLTNQGQDVGDGIFESETLREKWLHAAAVMINLHT